MLDMTNEVSQEEGQPIENLKFQIAINQSVETLKFQLASLQTEFRYFRNIMVTLYVTIVAPLVVAIFIQVLGGGPK